MTVAGNSSTSSAGGILASNGGVEFPTPFTFKSSLVAGNAGGNCAVGAPVSKGHNLDDTSPSTCGFSATTSDLVGVAPHLG